MNGMKATFFIALFWVSIAITSPTAHAQGQLVFANRVGVTGIDSPVFIGGTQSGPGPDYSAQLYLVGANNSLTPLFPITTFQAPGHGIAAIKSRYLESVVVQSAGCRRGIGGISDSRLAHISWELRERN